MFALFSEDVVRHWVGCEKAPYRDLGRPVLWDEHGSRYHVLDFTLERRSDGAQFVAEMKCEIECEGYRYLTLKDVSQLQHRPRQGCLPEVPAPRQDPKALRVTITGKE